MTLFQDSTTTNSGTLKITNMTNDALSGAAINAIGEELLDEEVESVGVVCTFSGSDSDGDFSQFDVFEGENYLFSVDNKGVTYSK